MKSIIRLLGIVLIAGTLSSCGYNSMVEKREAVSKEWANVESAYQRRADLIPNIVSTVKGEANFEQETLTKVIEARAKATSIQLDPSKLNEADIKKFEDAQNELKGSLSRLMVTVEKYPDLKATEAFRELQAQLEGTENRINTERNRFNEAVNDYNAYIAKFPAVMTAKMFGFTSKGYFQADKGSEKAPAVKF
ncbi:MAG: LemA family protein [Bacteroidetes bacterium]|nr:LemA family protein [Bacteroidota bacterium]